MFVEGLARSTMMSLVTTTLALISVVAYSADMNARCQKGEYLNHTCRHCHGDTYMPDDNHTNTACFPCFTSGTIKYMRGMTITQACNSTHQAEIGCIPGYFHVPANHPRTSPGECDPCQHCSDDDARRNEIRKCSRTHDTVCCESPDMVAVMVEGRFKCQGRGAGSTDINQYGLAKTADVHKVRHGLTAVNTSADTITTSTLQPTTDTNTTYWRNSLFYSLGGCTAFTILAFSAVCVYLYRTKRWPWRRTRSETDDDPSTAKHLRDDL